jgi:TIR domain
MLLAKDVAPLERDFISLLEHTPGTKAEKQAYFQSKGIRVPRTNYDSMWEVLTERLHHSGAAQSVFEYLQTYMPDRLRELLRIAARGRAVELRVNEPAIVVDFFFQNGHLRRIGELFLEHRPTHRGRPPRPVAAAALVQTAKPYEIAISFAGENRQFVGQVAMALDSKGVRVFYDEFERVRLLGKDLVAYFAEVYGKQARFCAMFISKHYVSKAWTQLERQHAQSRALTEKEEYILPLRLDDAEVPGLPATIGYIDIRGMTPKAVAEILFRKIRG